MKLWNIRKITIVGDSLIVICQFLVGNMGRIIYLHMIQRHIVELLKHLKSYSFFHVLRSLNNEVNTMANRGVQLEKGSLEINGEHITLINSP